MDANFKKSGKQLDSLEAVIARNYRSLVAFFYNFFFPLRNENNAKSFIRPGYCRGLTAHGSRVKAPDRHQPTGIGEPTRTGGAIAHEQPVIQINKGDNHADETESCDRVILENQTKNHNGESADEKDDRQPHGAA